MSNDHFREGRNMISDTPRTDAEAFFPHDSKYRVCDADFARQLERELNAANQIIRQQQLLDEKNLRLQDRIKRLEEFVNRFFDPEDLGYVVSTVVRDDAREAIGMKRVESGSRVSMI